MSSGPAEPVFENGDRQASGQRLAESFALWLRQEVERLGGAQAPIKPSHRTPFHWPPHAVSHSYHVHPTDWTSGSSIELYGESFRVQVAKTPFGVFGKIEELWLEARDDTEESMLHSLRVAAEPLFRRQFLISGCLGEHKRFVGTVRDLPDLSLFKLLYCEDRDVSYDATTVMELRARRCDYLPAMLLVIADDGHPWRRAAQWAVLDLFEDFQSFCRTPEEIERTVQAIKALMWNAGDDFARTIYKAGVVLGGHIPASAGMSALMSCMSAPSRICRRAAYHGLFHVVEWEPTVRESVIAAMRAAAAEDPDPQLQIYAGRMADDIASGGTDHVEEPVFDGER